jgi:hypothetical protein
VGVFGGGLDVIIAATVESLGDATTHTARIGVWTISAGESALRQIDPSQDYKVLRS